MYLCFQYHSMYTEPMTHVICDFDSDMQTMRDDGIVNGEPATISNVLGLLNGVIETEADRRCAFKLWTGIQFGFGQTVERFPGEVRAGGIPIGAIEANYDSDRTSMQQSIMNGWTQAPTFQKVGVLLNSVDDVFEQYKGLLGDFGVIDPYDDGCRHRFFDLVSAYHAEVSLIFLTHIPRSVWVDYPVGRLAFIEAVVGRYEE